VILNGTDCLLNNLTVGYSFIQLSNHFIVNNYNVISSNVINLKVIKNEQKNKRV
jgi:hypothetical protein